MRMTATLAMCLILACSVNAQTGGNSTQQSESSESARVQQLNTSMLEMYKKGKYDEALKFGQQALELIGKVEGEGSLSYANALFNLAGIYDTTAKYDDAANFYARSLAIYEKLSSPDSPTILRPLHKLAAVYLSKRDYAEAEPLYRRSISIKERASGFNDLSSVELLLQYSCALRGNQKETEADSFEIRAFSINLKENPDLLAPVHLPSDCRGIKAVKLPRPRYPDRAKAQVMSGKVDVEVIVDGEGKVISARALSGDSVLQGASVEAAYGAKFQPLVISGKPLKVRGLITYTFTAHR